MSNLSKSCLVLGVCLLSPTWAFAAIKEYHLNIDEKTINLTGKAVKKISVNGQFPAPLLEFEEGDDAVIHVHNQLKKQNTSVHWHGLLLPGLMDGVPGFNGFNEIQPDGSFTYKFKVRQSGTYWYHAHSKGQEQDGLYGALVIYPKGKQALAAHEQTQRDYVVMLSDFHESSSAQIMANLKKSAEYYQNQRETVSDVWTQIQRTGFKNTWQDRSMWNQMRMLKTDLSDVTGYTFLVNGKTPQQNWTGMFKPNEKVRLRFVNAAAMSFFDVRIPQLKMTVVSADGQAVKPVNVDEFRIGAAETYDVIVEPKSAHYQIEAESIDRTGFAIGTLHDETQPQHSGIHMPKARPRALLTMEDMGHGSMSGMDHSNMGHTATGSTQTSASQQANAHEHSAHTVIPSNIQPNQAHDHAAMGHDMDHSPMPAHTTMQHPDMHKQNMSDSAYANMDHSVMDHSSMNHSSMDSSMKHDTHAAMEHAQSKEEKQVVENSATVMGWANASTPVGDKALQYSDLKALTPQPDTREATQDLVIHLGGTMERYMWTMNGKKFSEAEPLRVKYGERIRLKFVNDSMMAHPMHLHGMFMQLENGQVSSEMPNKHTVIVPPGKTVTALLTANELGEWAIHCHLLYHMSAGMMNKLVVANVAENTKTASVPQKEVSHAHH
ncbi:multicopper oxidase domain-containing protein [Acinetobacter sp. YH12052]|uniref:multicopper oxidase domain-containing protein n=1 Tax=Acinetobacter sp. YH12052 TaxID=2601055 RepID=UPI0015D17D1D|nr:multicopper oxidase domain-containing protein [Acinetobacter sp. YH12052]